MRSPFVVTSHARYEIKHWIRREEKARSIELGRKFFEKEARRFDLNPRTILEGSGAAAVLAGPWSLRDIKADRQMAVVPLPDVGLALKEVEHALDVLKLDGVNLLTHMGDAYLGQPDFDELYAELDRRHAVLCDQSSENRYLPLNHVRPEQRVITGLQSGMRL